MIAMDTHMAVPASDTDRAETEELTIRTVYAMSADVARTRTMTCMGYRESISSIMIKKSMVMCKTVDEAVVID